MAIKYSMKQVWEARRLVKSGMLVKDIASRLKMSESSVRNYTKDERARIRA